MSETEFARLLELVILGMRTILSRQGRESPHFNQYAKVEQKILGMAERFGCGEKVDVGGDGKLVPSAKIDENQELSKLIEESDNDIFWHELVARMADRDLRVEQVSSSIHKQGGPAVDADARFKEIEDQYWAEFEKHDLARLLLMRGGRE